MVDLIVACLILLILGGAAAYIIREKKRGVTCVGCPEAKNCPHAGNGCSSHKKE